MPLISSGMLLCPTDFSAPAESALQGALEIAARTGGRVHVVHALEQPGMAGSKLAKIKRSEAEAKLKVLEQERLPELRARAGADAVPVTLELAPGDPVEVVLDQVRARSADLVVVATHGRTGLQRIVIGSVTSELVRQCPCPVLVVRHKG